MASQEPPPPPQQEYHWQFDDRNFQIHGRTLFSVIVIFSSALLITLIILYLRWFCHYRHLRNPHAPQSQPQGLDPATINSFPIVSHRSSTARTVEESECSICLGIFEDGEKVRVLPKCEHVYHSDCVDKWLRDQSSCPLCRSCLRVDSPV